MITVIVCRWTPPNSYSGSGSGTRLNSRSAVLRLIFFSSPVRYVIGGKKPTGWAHLKAVSWRRKSSRQQILNTDLAAVPRVRPQNQPQFYLYEVRDMYPRYGGGRGAGLNAHRSIQQASHWIKTSLISSIIFFRLSKRCYLNRSTLNAPHETLVDLM